MSATWLRSLLVCVTVDELDGLLDNLADAATAGFDLRDPAAAARAMASHVTGAQGVELSPQRVDAFERVIVLCSLVAEEYGRACCEGRN